MKQLAFLLFFSMFLLWACDTTKTKTETKENIVNHKSDVEDEDNFVWNPENFADKKIIRYRIPGFDKLSLKQKTLVYYLTQAGLSGRDIIWDTNYRYNLEIRHALEKIVRDYTGDRNSRQWKDFMTYVKNVWFSNGIHHHYGMQKFKPGFTESYFLKLLKTSGTTLSEDALVAIFNPKVDAKKVNLDPTKGLLKGSAVNFYAPDITEKEVDAYYAKVIDKNDPRPISYGLNSKMIKDKDGRLKEVKWYIDGMYGAAIKEIVKWLKKATTVAENEKQKQALELLIKYYETGDLKIWDEYNVAWVNATEGDVDYINGFVEVYNDPKGFRGSYETIVEIKDFDASERMKVVADNIQWFEDNSPIEDKHKKKNVVGVTYKVVNVAGEAGDASPSTPIGVNLPNANWIRAEIGSKSVSLGNLILAYEKASGEGMLKEFAYNDEEIELTKKYGVLADKLHTALHEVVGHASGQLEKGVGTPKETLKNYASTLEEARADLVGLYYLMDPKLVELGLAPSTDVGKAAYNDYIRNGMMTQLKRLHPGDDLEEAHMRNRQLVAAWAYENGRKDKVIEKIKRDGKTYFVIHDYDKLRQLFGELLRKIQTIKSQGNYQAGKKLVETYGVIVDQDLLKEVLRRSAKLNIPPYGGFINPDLVPVTDDKGEIIDIKVEYPDDFTTQMMDYAKRFSFLPDRN